jgi:hypothetical protein
MNKLRKNFFGMVTIQLRKKYAFMVWSIVCKSKSQGGLGVLDFNVMNISLLAKWLVRFLDHKVVGL